MSSLYDQLNDAIADAAGLSVNAKLSTLDGSAHLLPPTYANAPHRHNMTEPDGNGVSAWVSIDSAASFANRIEEQLARHYEELAPLRVYVETEERSLSTLQMPHRVFDAILRDSLIDGVEFRKTEIGQSVIRASARDAEALLKYDPAVVLLGGWDSTGMGSNRGHERKWPAALSVEITGRNARIIHRAGGRLDPLGITLDAGRVIRDGDTYSLVPEGEDPPSHAERPSEINHGNIAPSLEPKGVLVESIELSGAISLSRLRRYRFGDDERKNHAARLFLTCMGVYGIAAVIEDGLDLRRDCELVADAVTWTLRATGRADPIAVSVDAAREALEQAKGEVSLAEPITLAAGPNLEQLVTRSR
jgi:CRISPR-associated protein Csb1